ncbi:hypothetical protein CDAR_71691 [Caerostris darwini]|uniref:Uncharacterized protein n=1 Tax=Caerostris darwini TaxID=1538125 RepID=A0AAV4NMA8_9ARAC|nr:hypothetical protein CDAR_71691 [Caerostris darwini]
MSAWIKTSPILQQPQPPPPRPLIKLSSAAKLTRYFPIYDFILQCGRDCRTVEVKLRQRPFSGWVHPLYWRYEKKGVVVQWICVRKDPTVRAFRIPFPPRLHVSIFGITEFIFV